MRLIISMVEIAPPWPISRCQRDITEHRVRMQTISSCKPARVAPVSEASPEDGRAEREKHRPLRQHWELLGAGPRLQPAYPGPPARSFLFFAAECIPQAAGLQSKKRGGPRSSPGELSAGVHAAGRGRGAEEPSCRCVNNLAMQRARLCIWFSTNFILLQ